MLGVYFSIKSNSLTGRNISLFTVFDLSTPLTFLCKHCINDPCNIIADMLLATRGTACLCCHDSTCSASLWSWHARIATVIEYSNSRETIFKSSNLKSCQETIGIKAMEDGGHI